MNIDEWVHDTIVEYYEKKEKAFYTFIDMLGWEVIGNSLHKQHSILWKSTQKEVSEGEIKRAWKTFDDLFPKIESIIKKGDDNNEV